LNDDLLKKDTELKNCYVKVSRCNYVLRHTYSIARTAGWMDG